MCLITLRSCVNVLFELLNQRHKLSVSLRLTFWLKETCLKQTYFVVIRQTSLLSNCFWIINQNVLSIDALTNNSKVLCLGKCTHKQGLRSHEACCFTILVIKVLLYNSVSHNEDKKNLFSNYENKVVHPGEYSRKHATSFFFIISLFSYTYFI